MSSPPTGPSSNFLRNPPDFSTVIGGPLYQLFRRAHVSDDALAMVHRRIILVAAVCWLPLLVLSLLEGRLLGTGVTVPFLKDVEVHVRFLVVVPLLIAAELVVHRRTRFLLVQFLERNLIADKDLPRFEAAFKAAVRLRNSVSAEVLLIAVVYAIGIFIIWRNFAALETDSWYSLRAGANWEPTMAGLWYGLISVPIFQFLLIRWYFRILVWARFLWQVSRLDLRLIPTHPDRVGGLGFLSGSTYAYIPLLMAHGAMLSGLIAGHIFYLGEPLTDFKLEIAVMVIFLVLVVQAPLLAFIPNLAQAKRLGKREYGKLAQDYARAFDSKWLRGGADAGEPLLGSADIQSLADLGNSYGNVDGMRITLISRDALLIFAGTIVAPIVPLALTMMPIEELLSKLFGILF